MPSQDETSSCDDSLREAAEDHGGSSSSVRVARLRETILAVDRPRRLSGRIAEDPSQGKIPQLAAIYMFPSSPARPSCSPSPNNLLSLIQSLAKDPQRAQLRSQSSDPFLLSNPPVGTFSSFSTISKSFACLNIMKRS
ncbi:hypothetical protein VP01_51g10 [Puccinia sorghi]|uniref:Uncharacterized protein n=1 Tax=Puccinia sorghi TaxID=27349 RepID=A0A0L6UMP8_9BASI|nr:hypothetical protein VP01_51g10 [Puccinia sorghi]